MSYAKGGRKKGNTDSTQEALLSEYDRESNRIETDMRNLPYKINDLEKEGNELGTDSDNADFRGELNSNSKLLEDLIAQVHGSIQIFGKIQVEYKDEKKLKDKHEAFKQSLNDMAVKFKAVKKTIEEKMKQNMEFGKRRRQQTTTNQNGYNGGEYAMDGNNEAENQALIQQQRLEHVADIESATIQADAEFQNKVIDENQDALDSIQQMMGDLKDIQESTATELVVQTEKITVIDDNVTKVEEDVIGAHKEIVKAEGHQKGTGKCIYWVVGISVIVVIVIVVIIILT